MNRFESVFLYLVLFDARQVPAEAQTDLPALPLLQEQHGYTHADTYTLLERREV